MLANDSFQRGAVTAFDQLPDRPADSSGVFWPMAGQHLSDSDKPEAALARLTTAAVLSGSNVRFVNGETGDAATSSHADRQALITSSYILDTVFLFKARVTAICVVDNPLATSLRKWKYWSAVTLLRGWIRG